MKIGCPVILLLNLGGKLVNGLSGSVKKLDENVIHVHFNAIKETHSIRRHLFSKYSTKETQEYCRERTVSFDVRICHHYP